jgi:hypothetical protein
MGVKGKAAGDDCEDECQRGLARYCVDPKDIIRDLGIVIRGVRE